MTDPNAVMGRSHHLDPGVTIRTVNEDERRIDVGKIRNSGQVAGELGHDRASSEERWALSLISSGHYLSHFDGLALPPLFPLLKTEFGVTYIELGLAMTAYGFLGGLVQAPVGFLVDRLGPSRVLLAGMALIATSVLLMGFVPRIGCCWCSRCSPDSATAFSIQRTTPSWRARSARNA